MKNELPKMLRAAQIALQASDLEMSLKLRMGVDTYRAIKDGGRMLPLQSRKHYTKRVEGMLNKCGISLESER